MTGAAEHVETAPPVSGLRRTYSQWAANETLEDFALRYTARRARKWSYGLVVNTALGSISFLALEAIGGAITLTYGFENAVAAILIVGVILFLTGLPIAYHAAKSGVDIDLLTRGAGFGYIGSTVTSLVYASFTFIFFALEAVILSNALDMFFGVPLWLGYLLNALIVIPLVTHGFTRIARFQQWTQPVWIALQIAPFISIAVIGADVQTWTEFSGRLGGETASFNIVLCAAAAGVGLSLMAQIGEQVDFLRFLPEPKTARERRIWWLAVVAAGPGWAVIGTLKMLAGSFLAVMLLTSGIVPAAAIDPVHMYLAAYETFVSPELAVALTAVFVLLSQIKINVTNAYAGSIAWSNFFSRLTHSHPGRVIWLVFNVAIAVLLMQFGVFGALEQILALYAHVAVAWIGSITADLIVNKPLGLSPKRIEFRRAHLYDINPVGVGATLTATFGSLLLYFGVFGQTAAAFSGFVALGIALLAAPAIAITTRGSFFIAREPVDLIEGIERRCSICENSFDTEDMTHCPYHGGDICSLCCGLEVRCGDLCRPDGALSQQASQFIARNLPKKMAAFTKSRYGHFLAFASGFVGIVGLLLLMVRQQAVASQPEGADVLDRALLVIFGLLVIVIGVAAWLVTLARESQDRTAVEREHQTTKLLAETRAHKRTDAQLQRARDLAEAASEAKTRYIAGISHELRTPLNAILGYAQLLENDPTIPDHRRSAVRVIRTSSEHLADLIESLLDISKIEAGRLEISRDETKLKELLDQLAAIFEMQADEKNLSFLYDVSCSVPDRVIADERRLRQILLNLLSNAIRYTDQGKIVFKITYRSDVATITVEDTGRGIAESEHDRIFRPFERIEDPDFPVPGTGLGLTITKLMTELLGGELSFESVEQSGSTFQVKLMLPSVAHAPALEQRRRVCGYVGPRRTILIVDDNAAHRILMEEILRPLGFDLVFADAGESAISVSTSTQIDIAFLDVAMPGMSGWTLAEKLRKVHEIDAPIIMLSAHADPIENSDEGLRFHDDFITKPINVDVFLKRIERHLGLIWSTEEATQSAPRVAPYVDAQTAAALIASLEIGHVLGVTKVLEAIDGAPAAGAEFVFQARHLVEHLDLAGLETLILEAQNGHL